jgi:hypothetical protein
MYPRPTRSGEAAELPKIDATPTLRLGSECVSNNPDQKLKRPPITGAVLLLW